MDKRIIEALKKLKLITDSHSKILEELKDKQPDNFNEELMQMALKLSDKIKQYEIKDGYWYFNGIKTDVKAEGKDGMKGYTPVKGVDFFDGINGKDGTNGRDGKDGRDGRNGIDGKNGKDGNDGKDGLDGQSGISIEQAEIDGGDLLITIGGEKVNVGRVKGASGYNGRDGKGVALGGTTGQVLKKASNDDYDTEWGTGGGSSEIFTDATMTGDGTELDPLSVVTVTTLANGLMLATDKTKLNGIADNANNYTHPANHPPSIITQDSTNRFVTDTEKTTWNAKEPAITKATGFNLALSTTVADIKMNGTQSLGALSTLPRADHVHPVDTSRQATLVNTTNIKSVNGESLLGSGNIVVNGAVGGSTAYFLTSNFSNSTTTLADVTEWTVPVVAGKKYKFEVIGTYQTNTTTTGGKLAVYARDSAVTTVHGALWGSISDVQVATEIKATIYVCAASNATGSFLLTTGVATINRPHAIGGQMVISCTTSGNVRFQWAGEVATAAQLNLGSVLIVTPLN